MDDMLLDRPDWHTLFAALRKIPGGYVYSGVCSIQICSLPPCITGPSVRTGGST